MFEQAIEAAGEVALEAAVGFASRLALGEAAFDVGDGRGVRPFAREEDHVQRAVEFAVARSVESVTDRLAGGRGDRCRAGEPCERGFGVDVPRSPVSALTGS